MRRAADVDAPCRRGEHRRPARLGEPVAPVDLLAEEEEVGVGRARPRRSPRAGRACTRPSRTRPRARTRGRTPRRRSAFRSSEPRRRACGDRGTRSRAATGSGTRAPSAAGVPSGLSSFGADDRGTRAALPDRDHPLEGIVHEPRVGVQHQHPRRGRLGEPDLPTRGEAAIRPLEQPHLREALATRVRRVPSEEPLSTTTVSVPLRLSRHCSIQGIAL